jgi:GxxExxY protein
MELHHKDLTEQIIRTFYDVYNELGYGFLEKVYQNALFLELKSRALMLKLKNKSRCITKE